MSAREEAIVSGKETVHGVLTDRVLRTFEAIRACGPPRSRGRRIAGRF